MMTNKSFTVEFKVKEAPVAVTSQPAQRLIELRVGHKTIRLTRNEAIELGQELLAATDRI